MLTKIQKWGNSQGIRIPKSILEDSLIKVGEEVDISIQDGKILIEPSQQIHGRIKLKNLVNEMPTDYTVYEEDWGKPVGKEIW